MSDGGDGGVVQREGDGGDGGDGGHELTHEDGLLNVEDLRVEELSCILSSKIEISICFEGGVDEGLT